MRWAVFHTYPTNHRPRRREEEERPNPSTPEAQRNIILLPTNPRLWDRDWCTSNHQCSEYHRWKSIQNHVESAGKNPEPVLKGHLSFCAVHLSALILQKFYGELNLHKTHIGRRGVDVWWTPDNISCTQAVPRIVSYASAFCCFFRPQSYFHPFPIYSLRDII